MANELLDFVMSLVRDPDAAARYAADPSQAIANAHLANVTSADVNNLIPVVSESLSMGAPAPGDHAVTDGNVWASGAATAAFDAFSDHLPAAAVVDTHPAAAGVVDQPVDHQLDPGVGQLVDNGPDLHNFDVGGLDQPVLVDDVHTIDDAAAGYDHPGAFGHPVDHPGVDDHGFPPENHGFDLF